MEKEQAIDKEKSIANKNRVQQTDRREHCMLNIGAHISIAGGFEKLAQVAVEMKAKTFQYFSRNPRGRGKRNR